MGLKAGLQILQQTGKAVSRYTDDFVGLGVRNWTKSTSLEGLRLAPRTVGDTIHKSKTPLKEAMDYFKNVTKEEKSIEPIFENPNSPFAQYYMSTQTGLKIKPTLTGFRSYIYRNADSINVSKDDYYAIIKECAKEQKAIALADKSLKNIRKEFIDNYDKICEWREIFNTNYKGAHGLAYHKFYDEKIYRHAINEYTSFLEQVTGKKVLIGCPSRMSWGIEALGIFNNPKAYQDFDCILIGHGKGSSLITDTTSLNTWRFSDNDKSVWEFIEKHAKDKKIITLVCETNGLKLANKTPTEMIDKVGIHMSGIGNEVLPYLDAHSNPVKICKGGIRHIIGHVENSGKPVDFPTNFSTKVFDSPEIVYYDLGLPL